MKLTGQERIAASRSRVWEALNDPEMLRRALPGCQSLQQESTDKLRAIVEIKIGPIGARFNSTITLSDVQPSQGYTLICEGQGGTVGSAKAAIKVRLQDDGAATLLSYDMDADISGRLAQLGGPIVEATAKQFAAKFFKQFGEGLGTVGSTTTLPRATALRTASEEGAVPSRNNRLTWILALVVAALIGFIVGRETATPHITLDQKLLERLLREENK